MSKKNSRKPHDAVEQTPMVETQRLAGVLERDPGLAQAPDAPVENTPPAADKQERESRQEPERRRVIPWLGQAIPHKCPHCGAVVLLDRYTKACRVTTTRAMRRTDSGETVQDRDMECLHCHSMFIARESF